MASACWPLPRGEKAEIALRVLQNSDKSPEGSAKVFTSARLINRLLGGDILRPGLEECQAEGHQLQLLPSQTGKPTHDAHEEFLSCVCDQCFHHFRFRVDTGGKPWNAEKHRTLQMHMFLLTGRDDETTLKASRTKEDHVIDRVHFMCIVDDCHCKLEIERLPPRISAREVDALLDEKRIKENIRWARSKEPERIDTLLTTWNPTPESIIGMLGRYLVDGIEEPRTIKTHNKKFMIAFNGDFDDLWRTLGCTKKVIKVEGEPDEEAWQFPQLGFPTSPTPFGTRRAKWEDFESECMIHLKQLQKNGVEIKEIPTPRKTRPAFEVLKRILGCFYEPLDNNRSRDEKDLALLGCLANFKPSLYAEAVKILVEKCPPQYEAFLEAGTRLLVTDPNSDAAFDLMMFKSEAESRPKPLSAEAIQDVVEAFRFFDADLNQKTADYFIEKYFAKTTDPNSSEETKTSAVHHLTRIGEYLQQDLLTPVGAGGDVNSKMSRTQAVDIFGADIGYSEDLLEQIVNAKAQDPMVDRAQVAEALEVLADSARSSNVSLADKFDNWAGIFKASHVPFRNDTVQQPAQEQPSDSSTPPGLKNIGNTCYLNSLLQYIYTVTPVRELVLRYPQNSLNLDVESVAKRKLGYGNGIEVSLDEAIVGKLFVEVLQSLFQELLATTSVCVPPPQKLANTALRSASELLKMPIQQPDTKPPPLPARPSPAPPKSAPVDTNGVNVTVEPINDSSETASVVSSQTLVNDEGTIPAEILDSHELPNGIIQDQDPAPQGTVDTPMTDAVSSVNAPATEPSMEERIKTITQRLEQSERQGTEQQDVEEIIGFILEHLMRAISSSGPMPGKAGLQSDIITETFFPLIVNYTVKSNMEDDKEAYKSARQELIPDRWINAFPSEQPGVSSTLHDALSRSFGVQFVADSDLGRYSTIRQLSPIIHIRIQRANATSSGATKNSNPVTLTDEFFFDRYMDEPPESELGQRRQQFWAVQGRDTNLEKSKNDAATCTLPPISSIIQNQPTMLKNGNDDPANDLNLDPDADDRAVEALLQGLPIRSTSNMASEKRKSDSPVTNGIDLHPSKKRGRSSSMVGPLMEGVTNALVKTTVTPSEGTEYSSDPKQACEEYFNSLTEHKYRLHAVICHSGGARAGHYWVWIHDFRRDQWIKFNDGMVTIDPRKPQEVLEELNRSGDPCYLAYVRDEDKYNLVEIPARTPMVTQPNAESAMEVIEGIAPEDADMPDLVPVGKHLVTNDGIVETTESRPYELI